MYVAVAAPVGLWSVQKAALEFFTAYCAVHAYLENYEWQNGYGAGAATTISDKLKMAQKTSMPRNESELYKRSSLRHEQKAKRVLCAVQQSSRCCTLSCCLVWP